jgi:hypothetical protein
MKSLFLFLLLISTPLYASYVNGGSAGGGASNISDLGDVDTSGANDYDILHYQTDTWVPTTDPRFNSASIASDQKIFLEGAASDTYFIYNSADQEVELYVNNVLVGEWK